MAEATAHLPAYRPTEDHELPQGRKNWDTPPQQIDGPDGPEPHPTPKEAGAGRVDYNKKPQQVQPAKADREIDEPDPTGEVYYDKRPQQIDGPEGPAPTDGTELNAAVQSQHLANTPKGPKVDETGTPEPPKPKKAPAAKAPASSTGEAK